MEINTEDPRMPPLPAKLEENIKILAQVSQILELDDVTFLSCSTALNSLIDRSLSLALSQGRLKATEEELQCHLAALRHENGLLEHWNETLVDGYPGQEPAEVVERRRELLLKKAKEYHKELESFLSQAQPPKITITQVLKQQERNRQLEQDIKAKRAKLKAFQGLPPNIDVARLRLQNARAEQMKLIQLRERLLRNMADGVA